MRNKNNWDCIKDFQKNMLLNHQIQANGISNQKSWMRKKNGG